MNRNYPMANVSSSPRWDSRGDSNFTLGTRTRPRDCKHHFTTSYREANASAPHPSLKMQGWKLREVKSFVPADLDVRIAESASEPISLLWLLY